MDGRTLLTRVGLLLALATGPTPRPPASPAAWDGSLAAGPVLESSPAALLAAGSTLITGCCCDGRLGPRSRMQPGNAAATAGWRARAPLTSLGTVATTLARGAPPDGLHLDAAPSQLSCSHDHELYDLSEHRWPRGDGAVRGRAQAAAPQAAPTAAAATGSPRPPTTFTLGRALARAPRLLFPVFGRLDRRGLTSPRGALWAAARPATMAPAMAGWCLGGSI
jgi:hypothetical protein